MGRDAGAALAVAAVVAVGVAALAGVVVRSEGSEGTPAVDATTSTSTSAPATTTSTTSAATTTTTSTSVPPPAPAPPRELPHLTTTELGRLVDALAPYPGTLVPGEVPPILGHPEADARIRAIAEARGYRLRPVALVPMVDLDGIPVHPDAEPALRALLDAARAEGITIDVRSVHRSVDQQRTIFDRELRAVAMARLGRPFLVEEIAAGLVDDAVDEVLRFHSIPGYSRHHSGLAVDFQAAPGPLALFTGSPAERWLSADGFANALRFGFAPSYPVGAESQGPQPEPWEYVHLGVGPIRCAALAVAVEDPEAAAELPARMSPDATPPDGEPSGGVGMR